MKKTILILSLGFCCVVLASTEDFKRVWNSVSSAKNACTGSAKSPESYSSARVALCSLQSIMGLGELEKLSGMKVFTSGPHGANFQIGWGVKDFGKYNPSFVKWMVENSIPASSDGAFRNTSQPVYDKYFKKMAGVYLTEYYGLKKDTAKLEQLKTKYLEGLKRDYFSPYETFWQSAMKTSEPEAPMAVAFWVRRAMDGTMGIFGEGLEKLMRTYDENSLKSIQGVGNSVPVAQTPQPSGPAKPIGIVPSGIKTVTPPEPKIIQDKVRSLMKFKR